MQPRPASLPATFRSSGPCATAVSRENERDASSRCLRQLRVGNDRTACLDAQLRPFNARGGCIQRRDHGRSRACDRSRQPRLGPAVRRHRHGVAPGSSRRRFSRRHRLRTTPLLRNLGRSSAGGTQQPRNACIAARSSCANSSRVLGLSAPGSLRQPARDLGGVRATASTGLATAQRPHLGRTRPPTWPAHDPPRSPIASACCRSAPTR